MSVYSIDSLEDDNEICSRYQTSVNDNFTAHNLQSKKTSMDSLSDTEFQLKPVTPLHPLKQDTESNETMLSSGTDKDKRSAGSRNAIIASRRLTDASRRSASSKNGKRDVTDRPQRNGTESSKQEGSSNKRLTVRTPKRVSKSVPAKRNCWSNNKNNPMSVKPDKKLGNVITPRIQQAGKPNSYLELYRRRFSGPQYNARSPEGSTLSVWGDSEEEKHIDDDTHSFGTPRDDQSELSFYRRIIEGSVDPLAPAARSNEIVHRRTLQDTNTTYTNRIRRDESDDKSKNLGYKPYTIEEYKTLPIPKLDRSLGPDKIEMQAKREWLMRRRSYGNLVSAQNRQRILLQAHRFKTEDAIAEKCLLPPLNDQEADAKTQVDSVSSMISEEQEIIQENIGNTSNDKRFKKACKARKLSFAKKSKKLERTSCFCSSLNSQDIIEDSYLESLRERHVYEKEMVDRIVNQIACP